MHACTHAGSGGGGQAGKSRNSTSLNYERHVPKFLQPYAHLLGQQRQEDEEQPQVVAAARAVQDQADDEEEDKAAEQVRGSQGGPADPSLRGAGRGVKGEGEGGR